MNEKMIKKMNELLEELKSHRKDIIGKIGEKGEKATRTQIKAEEDKIDTLLELNAKVKRYLKGTNLMLRNRWLNK